MLNRRTLIGASAAAASLGVLPAFAQPTLLTADTVAIPRSGSAPRIVIAGGGWGGLTAARHLRAQVPDAEVIVIERNPFFWSCPISNKWLVDVVSADFLMHDTAALSRRHGYHLVRADITAIERETKRVRTSLGSIDYDFLVVAGGIRDAWDRWFGNDAETCEYTRRAYGSAYVTGGEHISIKQRIQNFKGGTFEKRNETADAARNAWPYGRPRRNAPGRAGGGTGRSRGDHRPVHRRQHCLDQRRDP